MPLENIPPGAEQGVTWGSLLLAGVFAFWGGIVSYLHRVRRGKKGINWREFLIDVITALFAGLLVFFIAVSLGVPSLMAGSLSGLGGHAGTRTVFLLQGILFRKAEKLGEE
jgi:hypothetical protein